MWWTAIIAGFTLGAVSSLHCVGMCGPLALALPIHHLAPRQQLFSLLLYQLGRVMTYSTFGLVFGLAGRGIYVAGFQQWFSIGMGIVVLSLVVMYHVFRNPLQPAGVRRIFSSVQHYMIRSFQSKRSATGFFLLGMANGLLPCAMVYVAIAGALTTTSIMYSVLFMAMFGAGTLPAMMITGYFGKMASLPVRNLFKRSVPVLMTVMAVILILRGLNLGIPFISPVLQGPPGQVVGCHP